MRTTIRNASGFALAFLLIPFVSLAQRAGVAADEKRPSSQSIPALAPGAMSPDEAARQTQGWGRVRETGEIAVEEGLIMYYDPSEGLVVYDSASVEIARQALAATVFGTDQWRLGDGTVVRCSAAKAYFKNDELPPAAHADYGSFLPLYERSRIDESRGWRLGSVRTQSWHNCQGSYSHCPGCLGKIDYGTNSWQSCRFVLHRHDYCTEHYWNNCTYNVYPLSGCQGSPEVYGMGTAAWNCAP